MEILILAAAKPSIAYAREGVQFFEQRLRPLGRVELRYVKAGSSEEVSRRLLEASRGRLRLAMDERGANWSTREWESHFRSWQLRAVKRVALLIGAADGHTPELREACDAVISLGRHTMQHELALVVLLEQVYRVHTLLAGSPYHRD
ncbi:MAG TPA: 23S rRNA (pseudouridine(1915)-N(3))-methyltransferase RlmH [Candidatus Akkermansia intestinavium]|nr:23S rRNA (pseudouridine(1915)-N(3))-methyltransferase RlmH [Candidatus Akkermansia intestinavium]